jgi:hypothetical protein
MSELVTIKTYTCSHEAFIDKSALEVASIECFLRDEMTISIYSLYSNLLGGVKFSSQIRRL